MKCIICFGKISEEIIAQFTVKDFKISTVKDIKELNKEIDDLKPILLLIEEGSFKEFKQVINKNVSFIVFTNQNLNINGLEFFRNGAIDYLSTASNDFVTLVIERLTSFISKNKKGFLDKIIQDSEQLYFSVIENSPIAILVCSREGHIIASNLHAKSLMKIKEEIDNIQSYLDPVLAGDFLKILQGVQINNPNFKFQCSIIKDKIDLIPIMWHFSHFDHVLDDTVVAFGENITDYVEMRKKEFYQTKSLLVLNERLERANKSLDQFSRMISHDLKNGLNRILGFTRILNQVENRNLSKEGKEIADKIGQNTEDMVLTVNRILDFAKSKGSNIQIRKFLINDLLQKVLGDFKIQLDEIKGCCELHSENIEIEADIICLKQIFENLISNSIKYRSPERSLLLKVSVVDMGADILIVFEDNGLGIKSGDEEKLFEEYYRNKEDATKVEGHGIGLSTVKTLLDSHGGVIWVDPELAVGASFNIQLPKRQ